MTFTVKDALAVAGLPATSGSRLLESYVPSADAPIVASLRAAGAVLAGKTNCAEFALAPVPHNDLFGTTLNPRDATLSVGGSSCGCAAAVAAGLVPFSVGSDYGGSVRYPAECAGIVGFRPALGSVDAGAQVPAPPPGSPREQFSVPGLLCRDVATLTRLVGVLLPDEPRHASEVTWADIDAPLLDEADALFTAIRATDDVTDLRALARGRESLLTAPMRALIGRAPAAPQPGVEVRLRTLHAHIDTLLDRTQVLLSPVSLGPIPRLDACGDVDALFRSLAPCRAITLLGLHSISVPAAHGRNVQVIARRGSLGAALRLAAELEAPRPA